MDTDKKPTKELLALLIRVLRGFCRFLVVLLIMILASTQTALLFGSFCYLVVHVQGPDATGEQKCCGV
jgi:hypothetical protein